MTQLANKTAAITGAASGIGRELAVQLAAKGCKLALADRDAQGLARTRELCAQVNCSEHVFDVADRAAMEQFAADAMAAHGEINFIFNNAGVTVVDLVESISYEDFEWLMGINFWGVVYGTKAFLPYLQKADEAHVINVSSMFGLGSMPRQSAYNASKFAVRGFTEALRVEMLDTSVGVTCVHPGGIKTAILQNARLANTGMQSDAELSDEFDKVAKTTAAQAAAKILRGVERNKKRVLIGPDARVFDWFVRLFPASYEKWLGIERGVRKLRASRLKIVDIT